ncbi:EAL domain-containing protein, partial [Kineococcus sp. T13]|uniref:GGDEF domain-containing phosphodiesterase n=1 Tax=Kineococcus vitellinus TaxID=2696565 RepID=UPI0014134BCE
ASAARLVAVAVEHPLDGVHAVDCSVGVASTGGAAPGGCGPDGGELLRRADAAMYVAKARGGGVARHDAVADQRLRRRGDLSERLQAAFTGPAGAVREEFRVHHQVQVDVRTGAVTGVEAQLRWEHPVLGTLPPAEFLPLAARRGLLGPLTAHLLLGATADLAAWRADGHELRLSFAVSADQLGDPALLALLDDVVDAGTDPSRLAVAVAEACLSEDPERALLTCHQITARGVGLVIDGFGTGGSSLADLAALPATAVKVDRSFTARLLADPRTAAIVAGTVDLAHHLGLEVVADGVADAGTLRALAALGCDVSQGPLHAPGAPAADVRALLGPARAASPAPRKAPVA